jgi:hypothetical protein
MSSNRLTFCTQWPIQQMLSLITRIFMEHSGALFDKDEAEHNVATLNCHWRRLLSTGHKLPRSPWRGLRAQVANQLRGELKCDMSRWPLWWQP